MGEDHPVSKLYLETNQTGSDIITVTNRKLTPARMKRIDKLEQKFLETRDAFIEEAQRVAGSRLGARE